MLTLLKHARTLGTESWGPSTPGMKSMRGPIQLNGLTIENSTPFSAPSAVNFKSNESFVRINVQTNSQYNSKSKSSKVIHSMLRANYGIASDTRRPLFRLTQELEVHHLCPVSKGEVDDATYDSGGSSIILRQRLWISGPICKGQKQER